MTFYAITGAAIDHYAVAVAQFEHLQGRLTHEKIQRVTHGELEAMVQAEGGELLRRLIQGHLDQRSVEESHAKRVVGEMVSRDRIGAMAASRIWRLASGR